MFFKLFLFLLPITNAFNLSAIFTFPFIVSILNALQLTVKGRLKKVIKLDYFFLFLLILVMVSLILNIEQTSSKTINHTVAFLSTIILFYYYAYLGIYSIGIHKVLQILYISFIVTILFGIIEFSLVNFLSYDFNSMVHRPTVTEYNPGFLSIILIRARSFFEESGYLASYMAIISPLLWYYLNMENKKRLSKYFFIFLSIIGAFIAFSVSYFLFFPIAILSASQIYKFANFKGFKITKTKIMIIFISLFLIILMLSNTDLVELIYNESIGRKFGGNSFSDRNEKFLSTFSLMINSDLSHFLFGYGSGSYEYLQIKPAISVYLNFFRDYGFIFVVIFLLLNIYSAYLAVKRKNQFGYYLLISLIVMNLFFISTPHYFDPHLFFTYALIQWNSRIKYE